MNKVGERYVNKFGSWYTIIEYKNSRNVTIQFDDGTIVKNRRYDRINKGIAVSPYDKSINNICCIGEGKYKVWEDGKHTFEYGFYHNITTRCFNSNYKDIEKTYQDVTICEEWKIFQNFAKWVENNKYTITFITDDVTYLTTTVYENELLTKPANPTKDDLSFEGWYTDSSLTTKYDFTEPVTEGFSLYAKFIETPFTFIFLPESFIFFSSFKTLTSISLSSLLMHS